VLKVIWAGVTGWRLWYRCAFRGMVQAGRLAAATSDSPCSIVIPVSNDHPVIERIFRAKRNESRRSRKDCLGHPPKDTQAWEIHTNVRLLIIHISEPTGLWGGTTHQLSIPIIFNRVGSARRCGSSSLSGKREQNPFFVVVSFKWTQLPHLPPRAYPSCLHSTRHVLESDSHAG
jgi:hypothetical protein